MITTWVPLMGALLLTGAKPATQGTDSALIARLGTAVNSTSDTLEQLRGVAQAFRNDLATASPTLILARATAVHDACAAGASAVRRLEGILAARTVSTAAAKSQSKFRVTAEETVGALDRCVRAWLPLPGTDQRADSLKAWGPYRVSEIEQAVRKYDAARQIFAKAAGLPAAPVKR